MFDGKNPSATAPAPVASIDCKTGDRNSGDYESGNRKSRVRHVARRRRRLAAWLCVALVLLALLSVCAYEVRTSAFSSRFLAHYARKMSFHVEPGPSPNIVFPKGGPFDIRAGYALMPDFQKRLEDAGYRVTRQARFSPELERITRWGLIPPYAEPTFTRLSIHDENGQALLAPQQDGLYFDKFEDIPPLAVKTLLLIENRELGAPADSRTNPVVDWPRLAKAAIFYAGNKLGFSTPVEGGSTLATQMEKYRHYDEGRTDSVMSKLRQMAEASLKVYQKGTDTREERRRIVLDYMNTIPLAAAPGYGEVYGLGNGLNAWFQLRLQDVRDALNQPGDTPEKARAFKQVVALLCAVRAPSNYLIHNRKELKERADFYIRFLEDAQVISARLSRMAQDAPVGFSGSAPEIPSPPYAESKATNQLRSQLAAVLGVPGFYELDRLHLDVESTIDIRFQKRVVELFDRLHDPRFVAEGGFGGRHLLETGDPAKVVYSLILFERTPQGNLLRGATDTLNAPFDINTGMKMQLGSTAKLRTLAHYLDIVASLHGQSVGMKEEIPRELHDPQDPHDPLTQWVSEAMSKDPQPDLDTILQMALERRYSAGTGETFFTGGGMHTFHNFQSSDGGRVMSVRDATRSSVNLVYVRIMRDIVRYYEARLPYNAEAVLADQKNPMRRQLLGEVAEEEARLILRRAYANYSKRRPDDVITAMLGENADSARHRAIAFYAWNTGATTEALATALAKQLPEPLTPEQVAKLAKSYGNPRLNLLDYSYLLNIHPLTLWCAGKMSQPNREEQPSWEELWAQSGDARAISSDWLFRTRNRQAQDRRLRIRIEQDAFVGITAAWRRLGFPFERLSPSLATALGSSGDRPEALAQLVGILLNGGVRKPDLRATRLHFAEGTPYETVMEPVPAEGEQVLSPAVSKAMLPVMAQVVEGGTAVRLNKAITDGKQPLTVGGKTGSGDNRYNAVGRNGQVIASRPVDRTATFAFYIGDRYFGVVTAFVPGADSGQFSFTSSLPVAVLKMLAPALQDMWNGYPAE